MIKLLAVAFALFLCFNTGESSPIAMKDNIEEELEGLDFNVYVMAMSHQADFCYQHRHDDYPGCHNPKEFWKGHLTIHGLWPSRLDGSWPSSCSREPFKESTWDDMGSDLERLWPNIKTTDDDRKYPDFWKHEWSKHGTCSGLPQEVFFKAALDHFLETPSLVREKYGATVTKTELKEAYGNGGIVPYFICSGGRFLSEVRSCISVDSDGMPTTQVSCPDKFSKEDNCGEEIAIASFPLVSNGDKRYAIPNVRSRID